MVEKEDAGSKVFGFEKGHFSTLCQLQLSTLYAGPLMYHMAKDKCHGSLSLWSFTWKISAGNCGHFTKFDLVKAVTIKHVKSGKSPLFTLLLPTHGV